jgi:hypothetical protein
MKEYSKPDDPRYSKRIRKEVVACILAGKLSAYTLFYVAGVIVNVIKY